MNTEQAVEIPENVDRFIREMCATFPDVMQRVLTMRFGNLENYFDMNLYGSEIVKEDVVIPPCGCLVGSFAIALFETRTSCALKGIDAEVEEFRQRASKYNYTETDVALFRRNIFDQAFTGKLVDSLVKACSPNSSPTKVFNPNRYSDVGGAVPGVMTNYGRFSQTDVVDALKERIRECLELAAA